MNKGNFNLAEILNGAFAEVKKLEEDVNTKINQGREHVTAHYNEAKAKILAADISVEEKIEAAFALGQHSTNPTPVHDPLASQANQSRVIQLPH